MSQERRVIQILQRDIDSSFREFAEEFTNNLRATTPIRTGFTRSQWRNTYTGGAGKQSRYPVAANYAGYIAVLDEGYSQQAPNGIVRIALQMTRKK